MQCLAGRRRFRYWRGSAVQQPQYLAASESEAPAPAIWCGHYPVGADKLVCSCGGLCGRDAAKHPYAKLAKNGVHSATLDTGIIKHWFGYVVPDANLGVACDRLVVLDIDPRHDGDQSLAALEHECALPETWRTLTGGGGEHIIFSCPDGVSIKNSEVFTMRSPL